MRRIALFWGVAVLAGCSREETDSKVTIDDHGSIVTFDDTTDDDHHVSCGPYTEYVNFFGFPAEDETTNDFQVAVEFDLFAGEDGDTLQIPDEVEVRVLSPFATTESEAVTLESGEVKIIVRDGGINAWQLTVDVVDGKNEPLALLMHGRLDCWRTLGKISPDRDAPIYDSEPHGDGDLD